MNENELLVTEAILRGDAAEAIRLLVEAAQLGNTIIRLCPDRDNDRDFSIRIEQLDYHGRRTITTMVKYFIGFIQQGMLQLERVVIEPIHDQ